jgi:hypothetical protein
VTVRGCDPTRERLSALLEGDLPGEEEEAVRAHLESCARCRAELDALRLTVAALRRLPQLPPPAAILGGVRARLAPEPWHRRLMRRAGGSWIFGVPVGAVATLLVVLGVAFLEGRLPETRRGPGAPPPPAPEPQLRGRVPAAPEIAPTAPAAGAPRATKEAAPAVSPRPLRKTDATRDAAVTAAAPAPALPAPAAPGPPALEEAQRSSGIAAATAERAPQPATAREPRPTYTAQDREGSGRSDADGGTAGGRAPAVAWNEPRGAAALKENGAVTARALGAAGALGGAAPAPAPHEVLYVWSRDGNDVEALRSLLQREGGSLVALRTLGVRAGREAILPLQQQMIPTSGDVRAAWEIRARVPQRNLDRFLDDLRRRPDYQLLQRQPAPAATGEHQDLRINLFR